MPQYLIAIQHPENSYPPLEGEAIIRNISGLNDKMNAESARFLAGGLESAGHAQSLRKQPDDNISITDGTYLEAKKSIGGLWTIARADKDEARARGRKPVVGCRVPVEVRAFRKISPNRNTLTQGDSQ